MRIFVALDIEESIRERVARFMEGVGEFAPDARWVRPESLHTTLKFLGERPAEAVEEIKRVLAQVNGKAVTMSFRGCGYFPTLKAPRVFWIGITSGPALEQLARSVDEATSRLGFPKEDHAFSPHLTLARAGSWQKGDRRNAGFKRLQEKLAGVSEPEFGTMTAREFFLYESKLGTGGARYSKIERYALT
jgi:2'-5' RNA ligase